MRNACMAMLALLGIQSAMAQHWKTVGLGPSGIGNREVRCLFGDTLMDRLLAGGTFFRMANEVDTPWVFSNAAWDGARWDTLGTDLYTNSGGEFAPDTYWFLRFEGVLYACGYFKVLGPDGISLNLGKLNEQTRQWESLECANTGYSGLKLIVPKEPQSTLYITGYMGELCGLLPPTCVFSYDGTAMERWLPYDQITEAPNQQVAYIFDFKGKTYMSGAFLDPTGPGFATFLRYDGTSWEQVPGWNNTFATIMDYSIRNDTLFIGGNFTKADGAPGDLVASFDGEQWDDLGGGMQCEDCWSEKSVYALQWFHGELWACGVFDRIAGIPAHNIAKWDGHRWCIPPGDVGESSLVADRLYDMAVWRDSLYTCGLFHDAEWFQGSEVALWAGEETMEACTPAVGVQEQLATAHLQVVPMPGDARWHLVFAQQGFWSVGVYGPLGQQVRALHTRGTAVLLDLTTEAPGIYILRAQAADGQVYTARVVRP